ncbi:MAG: hypothetical protein A3J79_04385 [Elusimicrobia bacterium RIFOXYB2_FULL_62_6]|nr:MAG: hypothetical protein A3J79_04385 [Elusimicrobia bacterium RIFOXYB2_FULL_62_6]
MKFWNLFCGLSAALPCFAMSLRLFTVWKDPLSVDSGGWVRFGVGIMIVEFLVVHSGGIFGAYAAGRLGGPRYAIFLLPLFYGVFAAVISFAFKNRSLLTYFAFIMAGRLAAIGVPLLREDAAYLGSRAGVALVLYMGMVVLTLIPLPRGGITPEAAGCSMSGSGSGVWVDYPHRPLLAGALYFFLLGCAEILLPFGFFHMEFSAQAG